MGSPHWCVTYTVKHEPLNEKDGNAVAVVRPLLSNFFFTMSKDDAIVSNIPLQVPQYVIKFLKQRKIIDWKCPAVTFSPETMTLLFHCLGKRWKALEFAASNSASRIL